jgi:hypothetical protein
MKGLVFFKDGHTEEIVEYFDWDEEFGVVYFDTASTKYSRWRRRDHRGYDYCEHTSMYESINVHSIERIELFKENKE